MGHIAQVSFKEFLIRLEKATLVDWVRLAAFIDAEGCIGINGAPPRGRMTMTRAYSMHVTITNTSPALFDWLLSTFGGKTANANTGSPWSKKQCLRWIINVQEAEVILKGCLPYLIIKREQAELALKFRKIMNERKETKRNVAVTTEELEERAQIHRRMCELNDYRIPGRVV